MAILTDQTENPLYDADILEKITIELSNKDVELVIVDTKQMQTINLEHRGKNTTTDVLSFPLEAFEHMPIGAIVINEDLVQEKALEYGHSPKEEFILLYIHGLLHLLGYDHEDDSGQMRNKEEEIITRFALPKSLIVRTQEGI